ncbi:MAG: DUF1844 domain-containing protein [Armatimonadota bacterium]|nr:DUF1844 domain-containing protein [bacterium]
MEQEPQGYEVKDKRRVNPDGTLKEDAAEQVPPEEPATEESREEGAMPPPNVFATMEFMVSMLAEQAWMLMGIRLAPGQKEVAKDMIQAKAAIDTIAFIVDKLNPHIEEQDRVALRGLVSDLQINFVRHS